MINEKYFEKIDCEEKAYLIGFIAADGYISPDSYKLTFGLNIQDKEILEKFCKLTKCQNKIAERKVWDKRTNKYYYQANLQVCCKKLILSLKKYGLDNNKTKNFVIQNIPEKYIKDCVRGLVDGDGYIRKMSTGLITTKENIEFISKWLEKYNIQLGNYISDIKSENNVFECFLYIDRFKFLDLIYEDNKICLSRKYNSYIKHKENFNNRTKKVFNTKILAIKGNFKKEFNSIKECSEELGISSGSICNLIAGRIKSCKGYNFIKLEKKQINIRVNK